MTRAQKLKWYAGDLMTEAAADLKAGNNQSAISHYLEAAEILLLLAKVEKNYTAWKYYTDTATQCQQTAKKLIAITPEERAPTEPQPPTPDSPTVP